MAEGQETREVVQGANVSGGANQPARQLGLVNVISPRGGSVAGVGSEFRALAEISKIATNEFDQYLKRKEDEAIIQGGMDAVQGKTEAELEAMGVSQAHLDGYHVMNAKTGYNEWFIQSAKNIDMLDHTMSTEEYKEKLAKESEDMLFRLGRNDVAREALTQLVLDGHSKLVAQHVEQNAAYRIEQNDLSAVRLLTSESLTGDAEGLQEILDNFATILPDRTDEHRANLKAKAASEMLNEGSFALFDALGGIKGLKADGVDDRTIASVKRALSSAQSQSEANNAAAIDKEQDEILIEIKNGMALEEAMAKYKEVQDNFDLSDTWWRSRVREADNFIDNKEILDSTNSIRRDPEFIDQTSQILQGLRLNGDLAAAQESMTTVMKDFNAPVELSEKYLDLVITADSQYRDQQFKRVTKYAAEIQEQRELDMQASNLSLDRIGTAPKNVAQRRAQQEYAKIAQSVLDEAEQQRQNADVGESYELQSPEAIQRSVAEKHVDFLKRTNIADKQVSAMFSGVSRMPPLNEDGTLNEDTFEAFSYMSEMRAQGMSEKAIKQYAGSAYEYLSLASELSNGITDPQRALSAAYDATSVPTELRVNPAPKINEVVKRWEDTGKQEFFDDIEPSLWEDLTGSAADVGSSEIYSEDVVRAMNNSEQLDTWYKRTVNTLAQAYPQANADHIAYLAKKELRNIGYVNGSIIIPDQGQNVKQILGLQGETGYLVETRAANAYMQQFHDQLFEPGSYELDTGWEFNRESLPMWDLLLRRREESAARTEEQLFGRQGEQRFAAALQSEERQKEQMGFNNGNWGMQTLSDGKVMFILYEDAERTKILAESPIIPGSDIGEYYKTLY